MIEKNNIVEIAKRHSIKREGASPDFFEGSLIGNGDLGAVVCSRPDALVVYFGHNSIWDIRICEDHKDKVKTFNELWNRILDEKNSFSGAEWHRKYNDTICASYHKLYPRPYPASALYLFFDRKEYEVICQELDISCGLVTVTFERIDGEKYYARIFISQSSDTMFCKTVNAKGEPTELFYRIKIMPHTPDAGLPDYTVFENGFTQILPYNNYSGSPREGVDKGFTVRYAVDGTLENMGLDTRIYSASSITVDITHGYVEELKDSKNIENISCNEDLIHTRRIWHDYWKCSGISIDDDFLEHIWYTNTYFIRCAINESCRCPGLFANWMYRDIGTAWHGDYHMNYNTQQPFWGLMGANRQALHMPYVRLAEELLPVSKAWAKDFYQMDGACFPHSAYPVPMTVNPYPTTDWGWEIFETPWTVQSLWWHYTYTRDKELLRTRLYPVMREAALFLVDYMTRENSGCKDDGKYHLFPTIVPELYGLVNGLDKNQDGIADLTLTKFLFSAMLTAINDLDILDEEAELYAKIESILSAYPEYPTATSKRGEVFVSVETEDPDHVVYNVPTNLMPIFPGEDIDVRGSSEKELEIAKRSWKFHYNEGGNDLVFYHLVGARLGVIDLEKFKRQIRYSLMPNGTATDRATLTGGRYGDDCYMDFMSRMGIWIENFSLYAVINECLIWGHTDTVRLFPNWDMNRSASFCTLRVKGAFLIDAECAEGKVTFVRVYSECGGEFRLENPWSRAVDQNGRVCDDKIICIQMQKGEEIVIRPFEKQ
ncbi:MAG: glycoside hydrolase N-terminal domain-containing protein [Clostridia bacterium]|nr:glycoside hydrolase N-terminal domain-containing protein [Clostridia bacterium]